MDLHFIIESFIRCKKFSGNGINSGDSEEDTEEMDMEVDDAY